MAAIEPTITGCILACNEERRIEDALRSLQGWTDEILVIDNESEDGTVVIARRCTDRVLTAPGTLRRRITALRRKLGQGELLPVAPPA